MTQPTDTSRIVLEVCVESLDDAMIAEAHGADRLELNSALSLGGLSPSAGLLLECLQHVSIPIVAMCRPRAGSFHYSPSEVQTMLRDARWMLEAGAAGIAFGFLTADDEIDREKTVQMRKLIGDRTAVFHRAFDMTPDLPSALDTLIELKIDRVLTSGGATNMTAGIDVLRMLEQQSQGRIEVLPGSGLSADHVTTFLEQTGCRQVHGSLSKVEIDQVVAERPRLRFVDPHVMDERRRVRISADRVQEMRSCLDAISSRSNKS